jgi:hypothetical protein
MNLKFEKVSPTTTRVMIDGVQWGKLDKTSHGSRGYSVVVRDMAYQPVTGQIYSAKLAERREQNGAVPFEERLAQAIERAIAAGKLVHPDILKQRNEAKSAEQARWRAEREAKEKAELEAKAREALADMVRAYNPVGKDVVEQTVAKIVEAMRWARSH